MKVPFSPPDIGKDEIKLVTEVRQSCWSKESATTAIREKRYVCPLRPRARR